MKDGEIRLRVNAQDRHVPVLPDRSLLGVLRNELGLTGAKYGCGEGQCGSCTVLVGGVPVHACQLSLREVGDAEVTTIEGLGRPGALNAVQRSFAEVGAYQCGYCTPGMVVRATALLRERPNPTREEIARALEGNLCRCCGYAKILEAVERAAARVRHGGERL